MKSDFYNLAHSVGWWKGFSIGLLLAILVVVLIKLIVGILSKWQRKRKGKGEPIVIFGGANE